METFSLKVDIDPLKKVHKYWIRKSKYITYIHILDYHLEFGFKCELIKLYPDHYSKTEAYLKPYYFQNYKSCTAMDYFDIEDRVKAYESDLEDYKKDLFKEIFDNERIIWTTGIKRDVCNV